MISYGDAWMPTLAAAKSRVEKVASSSTWPLMPAAPRSGDRYGSPSPEVIAITEDRVGAESYGCRHRRGRALGT